MESNKNLEKYLKDLSVREISASQLNTLSDLAISKVYKRVVNKNKAPFDFFFFLPRVLLTLGLFVFSLLLLSQGWLIYNNQQEGIQDNILVLNQELDDLDLLNTRLESMELEVQELLSLY